MRKLVEQHAKRFNSGREHGANGFDLVVVGLVTAMALCLWLLTKTF